MLLRTVKKYDFVEENKNLRIFDDGFYMDLLLNFVEIKS